MLAEFLQKVVDLGKRGDGATLLEHKSRPDKLWLVQGGTTTELDLPPPPRAPSLQGIPDVIEALGDDSLALAPEVYLDERGLVAFLNRDDRRQRLSMPFVKSERFKALERLATATSFSTTQAVKFLRFDLNGTGVEPVIAALKRVDFTRRSDGARIVEHGRESLGRTVEASVQQADAIPEAFRVQTPVFVNPGLRGAIADVRCGVYLDVDAEKVELRVLADELRAAVDGVLEQVAKALREALGPNVLVLHGSPGSI